MINPLYLAPMSTGPSGQSCPGRGSLAQQVRQLGDVGGAARYRRTLYARTPFLLAIMLTALWSAEVRSQGMTQMPGMADAKQETTASATGTVTAINTGGHKITLNHGPIPEIKWPAMKMEFPVVPSVDLTKVKVGDKVRFTLSGSKNSYTVQSINPALD